MIVITGSARVPEENRAEFGRVAERQVRLSREEPGTITYGCFEDRLERGRFFFYEEWKDRRRSTFISRKAIATSSWTPRGGSRRQSRKSISARSW